jgi:hypothetical protein
MVNKIKQMAQPKGRVPSLRGSGGDPEILKLLFIDDYVLVPNDKWDSIGPDSHYYCLPAIIPSLTPETEFYEKPK